MFKFPNSSNLYFKLLISRIIFPGSNLRYVDYFSNLHTRSLFSSRIILVSNFKLSLSLPIFANFSIFGSSSNLQCFNVRWIISCLFKSSTASGMSICSRHSNGLLLKQNFMTLFSFRLISLYSSSWDIYSKDLFKYIFSVPDFSFLEMVSSAIFKYLAIPCSLDRLNNFAFSSLPVEFKSVIFTASKNDGNF